MGFALSPSVNVKEIDLSTVVPAVATSICGVAGEYQWGPCFDKKLVTDQKDLVTIFGKPNDACATNWWASANFLAYSNTLYVTRAVNPASALNAGLECLDVDIGGSPTDVSDYLPNSTAVDNYSATFTSAEYKLQLFAKYPGAFGSTLQVAVANATDWDTAEVVTGGTDFIDEFEYSPADFDTTYFGIVVLDADGVILERHLVSFDSTAKDFEGNSLFVETHLNRNSSYLNAFYNTANTTDEIDSFVATSLINGADGTTADADIQLAYDEYNNAEEFDVNIIIDGGNNIALIQQYILDNICEVRMDCIGVFSVPKIDVVGVAAGTAVTNCAIYKTIALSRSSSYAAIYGNWKYQYDKYNDVYRWIPISGDAAGIYARTDNQRDPWFAPAGLNRGQVKNVVKLAFNPNRAQRDALYKSQVNPIVNFAADGPVVFGQKTLQAKPSAFDRIDVRRLFIVLEKAISTASKYFLFEKNTAFTRRQLVGMIEPFLRRVQGRQGIYEFLVVCDDRNNTPAVIDGNELVCDIFIQPTKSAEFITLNFIATRTGVDFNELIGNV